MTAGTESRGRGPSRSTRAELRTGEFGVYDLGRGARTGAPEVVLGDGKSVAHLIAIIRDLQRARHPAFVSRLTPAQRTALRRLRAEGVPVRFVGHGSAARIGTDPTAILRSGPVAIVTAGTSDVPVASEARALLEWAGVRVVTAFDVGVAGLHRLQRAVRRLERRRPRVYLAFAGREGALPTVLAGLVRAPVVGVPTSIGYGRGGRGAAALDAMLQSCAPVAVVNIDAGVPAALFALQLLAAADRAPRAGP